MAIEEETTNMMQYLRSVTSYSENYLRSISDDQLFMMYRRVKRAMQTYPQEIKDYLLRHPECLDLVKLVNIEYLNYNELVELCQKLGIKHTKSRVVSSEPAPAQATLAKSIIKRTKTSDLAMAVIQQTQDESVQQDHEQILTPDEIALMYGEDIRPEELAQLGIVCDQVPTLNYSNSTDEDERINLIDEIIDFKVQIGHQDLNYEQLLNLSMADLRQLKNSLSTITSILGPKPNRLLK